MCGMVQIFSNKLVITNTMFISIGYLFMKVSTAGRNCDGIQCSLLYDPVCGMTLVKTNKVASLKVYQNLCTLQRFMCEMSSPTTEVKLVPNRLCKIRKRYSDQPRRGNGRRVADFGIVGAHQACNHSCPTHCVDTYKPTCVYIYKPGSSTRSHKSRVMINHCHVDLLSCTLAVNVTIHPLTKCMKNPNAVIFMTNMAAAKSLHLLDEPEDLHPKLRAGQKQPAKAN